MDKAHKPAFGRRDLFRSVAVVGAVAAVTTACSMDGSDPPPPKGNPGKRKSQYQANSPEVRTFYRVNGYPTK